MSHSCVGAVMTPALVCVALCLSLLTVPGPLHAAPAIPDPAAANLLWAWQQGPSATDDGALQGGVSGAAAAREAPGEDYTVSMSYGFPLYTFYIPFKGTQ
ncbi:uncharacterized protein LOC126997755 isoform X2 [Eriocheir sinensis]|uniref:uncharacterized protein LOC126994143 isoform X2 n=1 Tax=Eriocheir sinensis TaxID=95602 RepID=UPI0021C9E7EC|nr:uncharacterized protein LOC126994143 isoform X2 [Eriocheir sinensis]XP_050714949.1 uncharacterized protein LOC126997755 isoform X2 [Eriocheir sinensis]